MTASIDERIDAGVAWLDANVPDWLDRIDLDRLNLASTCQCVLGQAFAHMASGYSVDGHLLIDGWAVVTSNTGRDIPHLTFTAARHLGFNGLYDIWADEDDVDAEMSALTDAWRSRITALRSERQAAS